MAVVIIRAVQRHNNRRDWTAVSKPSGPEKSPVVDKEVVKAAVERNRGLCKVEGMLTLCSRGGSFFGSGDVAKECWFELDPGNATFSYWSTAAARFGTPRQRFELEQLQLVDRNASHWRIFVTFDGNGRVLQLMASNQQDFDRWVAVFDSYCVASPVTAGLHVGFSEPAHSWQRERTTGSSTITPQSSPGPSSLSTRSTSWAYSDSLSRVHTPSPRLRLVTRRPQRRSTRHVLCAVEPTNSSSNVAEDGDADVAIDPVRLLQLRQ